MGVELLLQMLALPHGHEPDWGAAQTAIDDLRFSTIWSTGDLFPWEEWLTEGGKDIPNPPHPDGVAAGLHAARSALRHAVDEVSGAMRALHTDELLSIQLPRHTVFMAGDVSAGPEPPGLYGPLEVLIECGVAEAAGFTVPAGQEFVFTEDEPSIKAIADDVARSQATPHIASTKPRAPTSVLPPLAWLAYRKLDWAGVADETANSVGRPFDLLRGVATGDSYDPLATNAKFGRDQLLVACSRELEDAIRELETGGVLAKLGAERWGWHHAGRRRPAPRRTARRRG